VDLISHFGESHGAGSIWAVVWQHILTLPNDEAVAESSPREISGIGPGQVGANLTGSDPENPLTRLEMLR
jgi:hypothetical protein